MRSCVAQTTPPPASDKFCDTIFKCHITGSSLNTQLGTTPEGCSRAMREYEPDTCGNEIESCVQECVALR